MARLSVKGLEDFHRGSPTISAGGFSATCLKRKRQLKSAAPLGGSRKTAGFVGVLAGADIDTIMKVVSHVVA
jgi:hypothetical protein